MKSHPTNQTTSFCFSRSSACGGLGITKLAIRCFHFENYTRREYRKNGTQGLIKLRSASSPRWSKGEREYINRCPGCNPVSHHFAIITWGIEIWFNPISTGRERMTFERRKYIYIYLHSESYL
jgi:hypothetical protein